jgi:tetratricopeptide (TPR) repeat protein
MYDVELLEKKWKRYRFKRRLPWIGFILLIAIVSTYVINREIIFKRVSKYFGDKNITKVVVAEEINCTLDNRTVVAVEDNLSDEEYNQEIDRELAKNDIPLKQDKKRVPSMEIEFTQERVHKRKYLNIVVTDRDRGQDSEMFDTLSIVEKRYNESKNYEDAIYLAEGYYEQKLYEKALKWALESNNLNSNSQDSWLIFAKSKARLGDWEAGEKILEAYLKENRSKEAENLLHLIETGKF